VFKKQISIISIVLSIVACILPNAAMAELAIIVNPSYSGSSLSIDQVKDLYMGKRKSFPEGTSARPVDQPVNSSVKQEFLEKILNKSQSEVNRHWSRIIFSGKGSPPEIMDSDEAVLRWISRNENAIGYIDASRVNISVKVVLVVK